MKISFMKNVLAILIFAFIFIFVQLFTPAFSSNKATWQELESIGMEFAKKVPEDEAYRSIAIAALWESICKDSKSVQGAKTLLNLYNVAEKADIAKVTNVVALLNDIDKENEYEHEKIFSNILSHNGEAIGSIAAMQRAIATGKATNDEILSFAKSVWWGGYDYDDLDEIPGCSSVELKPLLEDLAEKNESEAYRLLASFNERDPNVCKKYLLSAVQYAKSDEESSSALASLLTYPIELSEDERINYKKLRFRSRMKTWDDAIDDLDGVFRSLLNAQDYNSVIELWQDEDVKRWHEGDLSRKVSAIYGRCAYAKALLSLDKTKEAIEELRLVRDLCSRGQYWQIGEAYWWEGQCYLKLKDIDSAQKSIANALELYQKSLDRSINPEFNPLYENKIRETEVLIEILGGIK